MDGRPGSSGLRPVLISLYAPAPVRFGRAHAQGFCQYLACAQIRLRDKKATAAGQGNIGASIFSAGR